MSWIMWIGQCQRAGAILGDCWQCDLVLQSSLKDARLPQRVPTLFHDGSTEIAKTITGVAQPQITIENHCRLLPFLSSPLEEQRRIVAVLDEAFAAIATATANAEKNLANARELFEVGLDKAIGDSGDGRECARIADLCIIGDGNHSSKYPKNSEMVASGVPFLRSTNLQDGEMVLDDVLYISEAKHAELKKGHLKTNDVLFTNRGEIGKVAIVTDELNGSNLNSQIAWLRCKERISSEYLYFFLQSAQMRLHYLQNQSGAALQQFTIRMLKDVIIYFPDLLHQQEIVKKLRSLLSEKRSLEDSYRLKLAALSNLKQSVLRCAFSGDLTRAMPDTIAA